MGPEVEPNRECIRIKVVNTAIFQETTNRQTKSHVGTDKGQLIVARKSFANLLTCVLLIAQDFYGTIHAI